MTKTKTEYRAFLAPAGSGSNASVLAEMGEAEDMADGYLTISDLREYVCLTFELHDAQAVANSRAVHRKLKAALAVVDAGIRLAEERVKEGVLE